MKTLEEMTREELYNLCVELIVDGAEVQGCENEDFAKRFNVKW